MLKESILKTLRRELESAKAHHQALKDEFWRVNGPPGGRLPSSRTGIPASDGNQMVRRAAADEAHARKEHFEALKRLNAYLLYGTVPEHLKKKPISDESE